MIQKINIPWLVSQATAFNHSDLFIFTLVLSDVRTWEISNEIMLFLPPSIKMSVTFTMIFHFHLLFCYIFYLLPLSFFSL
jgi:hypothetical protein